jgi:hypothetical protein
MVSARIESEDYVARGSECVDRTLGHGVGPRHLAVRVDVSRQAHFFWKKQQGGVRWFGSHPVNLSRGSSFGRNAGPGLASIGG